MPLVALALLPDDEGELDTSFYSRSDDGLLALVLISTWALRTGRTLSRDVPPSELTAAELIAFWSDPFFDVPSPEL